MTAGTDFTVYATPDFLKLNHEIFVRRMRVGINAEANELLDSSL